MNKPDYKIYNIVELNEALHGVNETIYPERKEEIISEIQRRKEAGYSLTAEKGLGQLFPPHISTFRHGLPIWWTIFWRHSLAILLVGIITKVLLNTVSIALGNFAWWSDLAIAINTSVVLVAYPYFGAIFVKQALGKKYMSFGLEMVDHHANQ